MFSLFFPRVVPRSPHRKPPLLVEALEDRLAPASGFFLPSAGFSALEFGLVAHLALSKADAQPMREHGGRGGVFEASFPARSGLESYRGETLRGERGDHPFLATLAARLAVRSSDTDLPQPTENAPAGDSAAPFLPLGIGPVSLSPIPALAKPNNAVVHLSASASVAAQNALAYLPKRPSTGNTLGFPTFTPPARKPTPQDRPLKLALSPFGASGPDIVPVPEPHGMEERLAELFGDAPPRRVGPDSPLEANDEKEPAAAREAVLQLLHEEGTLPRMMPFSLPPAAAEDRDSPNAATDAIFAGTPFDPMPEGETVEPSLRSVVVLLAVTAGFGQRNRKRERSKGPNPSRFV